jgi:hypothetical protein
VTAVVGDQVESCHAVGGLCHCWDWPASVKKCILLKQGWGSQPGQVQLHITLHAHVGSLLCCQVVYLINNGQFNRYRAGLSAAVCWRDIFTVCLSISVDHVHNVWFVCGAVLQLRRSWWAVVLSVLRCEVQGRCVGFVVCI